MPATTAPDAPSTPAALAAWHRVVQAITFKYLAGALQVLNNPSFRCVREIVGRHDALLEFITDIDGVQINGIDLIAWNEAGQIVDFKVMVRPLKAVNLLHQKMGQMLETL